MRISIFFKVLFLVEIELANQAKCQVISTEFVIKWIYNKFYFSHNMHVTLKSCFTPLLGMSMLPHHFGERISFEANSS